MSNFGKKYDAKNETTAKITHCMILTSLSPKYQTYKPVINAAEDIASP
jgi:hypothetical protein